jgi:hypothetical protein
MRQIDIDGLDKLAGLHQAEHAVMRLSTVTTGRAARNLSLDDKATQVSLRRSGMERGFGSPRTHWIKALLLCLETFSLCRSLLDCVAHPGAQLSSA